MEDGQKLGIENLKKVIVLTTTLANTGDAVGHDTTAARWAKLLGLISAIPNAASIDFKAVMPEIKDLDEAEKAEILALFKADFDIADDKLEAAIEDGLAIVHDLVSVVERSVALVKTYKAG